MNNKFTIAICGAGPTAQTLALTLIKRGVPPSSIVLMDARTHEQARNDQRTIALSFGSQQILEAAGAWPIKATEIHQIHVSRRGQFGRTLIDRDTCKVPALGYVARYADILEPLSQALGQFQPQLTLLRPVKVSAITETERQAQITLDDQRVFEADIVVQAEGGLFGDQTPQTRHHDYQQTALISMVRCSAPIAGRAFERFTDQGPLALLPVDDAYALVWCVQPDRASGLLALDDRLFLGELQTAFGGRLGQFTAVAQRSAFPLGLNAQTSPPTGRCIRIGNAAHTLHPVAGQGLNLGLRDAFQLGRFLSLSATPAALQQFFAARSPDRQMTMQLTSRMAQIFTTAGDDNPVANALQSLLGAGLGVIDVCPPAKNWLAEQMMFGKRD